MWWPSSEWKRTYCWTVRNVNSSRLYSCSTVLIARHMVETAVVISLWNYSWNQIVLCLLVSAVLHCISCVEFTCCVPAVVWYAHIMACCVRIPAMLCGVVLCCVVLCGVVWCCVVLCCAMLCGAVWCCVVWCCVVLCSVGLCGVVLCGVVWCCVVVCCVAWCCVVWCCEVWCCAVWCCVVLGCVVWCCVVWCCVMWCCVVLCCALPTRQSQLWSS